MVLGCLSPAYGLTGYQPKRHSIKAAARRDERQNLPVTTRVAKVHCSIRCHIQNDRPRTLQVSVNLSDDEFSWRFDVDHEPTLLTMNG